MTQKCKIIMTRAEHPITYRIARFYRIVHPKPNESGCYKDLIFPWATSKKKATKLAKHFGYEIIKDDISPDSNV